MLAALYSVSAWYFVTKWYSVPAWYLVHLHWACNMNQVKREKGGAVSAALARCVAERPGPDTRIEKIRRNIRVGEKKKKSEREGAKDIEK